MDTRAIGVFDSGVGGLSAVRALRALLPGEDILFLAARGAARIYAPCLPPEHAYCTAGA